MDKIISCFADDNHNVRESAINTASEIITNFSVPINYLKQNLHIHKI